MWVNIQVAPPVYFGYHIGGYYSYLARESQNYSSFEVFAPSKKRDCIHVLKRKRDIMIIFPYNWGKTLFHFIIRGASLRRVAGFHKTTLSATIFTLFLFSVRAPVGRVTNTLFFKMRGVGGDARCR